MKIDDKVITALAAIPSLIMALPVQQHQETRLFLPGRNNHDPMSSTTHDDLATTSSPSPVNLDLHLSLPASHSHSSDSNHRLQTGSSQSQSIEKARSPSQLWQREGMAGQTLPPIKALDLLSRHLTQQKVALSKNNGNAPLSVPVPSSTMHQSPIQLTLGRDEAKRVSPGSTLTGPLSRTALPPFSAPQISIEPSSSSLGRSGRTQKNPNGGLLSHLADNHAMRLSQLFDAANKVELQKEPKESRETARKRKRIDSRNPHPALQALLDYQTADGTKKTMTFVDVRTMVGMVRSKLRYKRVKMAQYKAPLSVTSGDQLPVLSGVLQFPDKKHFVILPKQEQEKWVRAIEMTKVFLRAEKGPAIAINENFLPVSALANASREKKPRLDENQQKRQDEAHETIARREGWIS